MDEIEQSSKTDRTAPHWSTEPGRPFIELRDSGLLWLLNASVFHPRGLGLALHYDNGAATGWSLINAGEGEPFSFPDSSEIHELFRAAERTIAEARDMADKED